MTTTLHKPFELFSWHLWGYVRLHRDSLDSERWTEQIQSQLAAEVAFVVEPLKLEIARLNRELLTNQKLLKKARAEAKALRAHNAKLRRDKV